MEIYLAGISSREKIIIEELEKGLKIPYMLESFMYFKEFQHDIIKNGTKFILDSGAFTFIHGNTTPTIKEIEQFTYKYIEFINKYDIEYFFEMDIDKVIGLKKVEELRELIEKETNKKTIPVFHQERGLQYFHDMIDNYNYVALGGSANNVKSSKYKKFFPYFIQEAKKKNCKIHGLGFTALSKLMLPQYNFDSVDSTTWLHGHRFSNLFRFTGKEMKCITLDTSKKKDLKELCKVNLKEWIKFCNYMGGKENGK